MWRWNKRLDVVLASEAGDDSIAALATIVRFHDRSVTLEQVRQAVHDVGGEANAAQIADAAERFSLQTQGFMISHCSRIAQIRTPSIAHMVRVRGDIPRRWQNIDGYFAVVGSISMLFRRVAWIDPYSGRTTTSLSEFLHYASGAFLVFEKAQALPRAKLRDQS
jgi:ABC-type bacteriocin/lantibiotic exporter with double-glycine peptidase domain